MKAISFQFSFVDDLLPACRPERSRFSLYPAIFMVWLMCSLQVVFGEGSETNATTKTATNAIPPTNAITVAPTNAAVSAVEKSNPIPAKEQNVLPKNVLASPGEAHQVTNTENSDKPVTLPVPPTGEKGSVTNENALKSKTNELEKSSLTEARKPAKQKEETPPSSDGVQAASELGELPLPNSIKQPKQTTTEDLLVGIQRQLDLAREQRREKNYAAASQILSSVMSSNVPTEMKRICLFELALVAQDENKLVKAQQIFSQYVHIYNNDPSLPEVLLRQGLIYRQMGVNSLAISKFYTVMASALKLKLENIDYYKKLVLQAQVEIADTYYLDGNYDDSSDLYNRLLKSNSPELDRERIHFKLVRSLSFKTNVVEMISKGQSFLEIYPDSPDVPEVRFILSTVLKRIGRNQDAMKQVLLLLDSQQGRADKNPAVWIYWQQRAGNEIASQLYKEGDFMNALRIYLNLATLDKSPEWQLPVWYQTGLVYEQLMQQQKAVELYGKILERKSELAKKVITPGMESLLEMTQWRKDYLQWLDLPGQHQHGTGGNF